MSQLAGDVTEKFKCWPLAAAYLCSLLKHKKRPDGRVCAAADRVLQDLQRQGRVRPGALDERCMDNLARLPDHVQVTGVNKPSVLPGNTKMILTLHLACQDAAVPGLLLRLCSG